MKKYWLYLKYIIRHKLAVYKAGKVCEVNLWRRIKHDWSRFLPSEFMPYANFFYGEYKPINGDVPDRIRTAFERAWLKHVHRNDHHFEHWVTPQGGIAVAQKMPEQAWRELCADYLGMEYTLHGNWDAIVWYSLNQANITLHNETRFRVESLLKRAGSELSK